MCCGTGDFTSRKSREKIYLQRETGDAQHWSMSGIRVPDCTQRECVHCAVEQEIAPYGNLRKRATYREKLVMHNIGPCHASEFLTAAGGDRSTVLEDSFHLQEILGKEPPAVRNW